VQEIGKFQTEVYGFSGPIETLAFQLNPVRMKRRDKGADYGIYGPDDCELGAAWRRSGEYGDYLSVKLDCPSLPAPINAIMRLTPDDHGFYALRWQRRPENGRGKMSNGPSESSK
jgi:uncharacterized protein (DUF736 family)